MSALVEVRTLLERAQFDLERGWIEAALDCLGRAMRLRGELEGSPCSKSPVP